MSAERVNTLKKALAEVVDEDAKESINAQLKTAMKQMRHEQHDVMHTKVHSLFNDVEYLKSWMVFLFGGLIVFLCLGFIGLIESGKSSDLAIRTQSARTDDAVRHVAQTILPSLRSALQEHMSHVEAQLHYIRLAIGLMGVLVVSVLLTRIYQLLRSFVTFIFFDTFDAPDARVHAQGAEAANAAEGQAPMSQCTDASTVVSNDGKASVTVSAASSSSSVEQKGESDKHKSDERRDTYHVLTKEDYLEWQALQKLKAWFRDGEVGSSSAHLALSLLLDTNYFMTSFFFLPYDASDFARCEHVIRNMPELGGKEGIEARALRLGTASCTNTSSAWTHSDSRIARYTRMLPELLLSSGNPQILTKLLQKLRD